MILAASSWDATAITGIVTLIAGLLAGGAGLLTAFAQRNRNVVESYRDFNQDIIGDRNRLIEENKRLGDNLTRVATEYESFRKDTSREIEAYRRMLIFYGIDPDTGQRITYGPGTPPAIGAGDPG